MAAHEERGTVAVVGTGPAGLAAIKYLRAEGFQVTAFERRPEVGGVWTFSDEPFWTSTLKSTRSQVAKYGSGFSDSPVPEDWPPHMMATEWSKYYQAYARHNDLYKHITFNTSVTAVSKTADGKQWVLSFDQGSEPRAFDKLVWATGGENRVLLGSIPGAERFGERLLHSQQYKGPEDFRFKKVVVVGFGNTAVDIATDLAPTAGLVLLAHRRGATVVPRVADGKPLEYYMSWTATRILNWIGSKLPSLHGWLIRLAMGGAAKSTWGPHEPHWRFDPPTNLRAPYGIVFSDDLVPAVRARKIYSMPGVKRVLDYHSVEFDDGKVDRSVDYLILATGYAPDMETLGKHVGHTPIDGLPPPQPDPSALAGNPEAWSGAPVTRRLPDLYQNIFPPDSADSLACLNNVTVAENLPSVREVCAMAVAQVWAGKSALPPRDEMEAQVARHRDYIGWLVRRRPGSYDGIVEDDEWSRWLHQTAGTGLYENVGWWSWAAWRLWWRDRKLYNLVAHGVYTPLLNSLFETGKRPAWPGARDAIIKVNEQLAADVANGMGTKKTD